jgi:hypothetical protein
MRKHFLIFTIAMLSVFCALANDFVNVGNAVMLVITHNDLRTPNWQPNMAGAWETELLEQKGARGISVALYQIGDNVSASTIRTYIQTHGTNLRYVYIIGDADNLDIDPENPVWPVSDAGSNLFVPFYGEIADPQVFQIDDYAMENDLGYIEVICPHS